MHRWITTVLQKVATKPRQKLPHAMPEILPNNGESNKTINTECELTVRIVDRPEMTELNQLYRKKIGPTNVLAFPFDKKVPLNILGDIVICAPVVAEQANALQKPEINHWAHMIIHGALHLCGYDHQTDKAAMQMEKIEQDILADMKLL